MNAAATWRPTTTATTMLAMMTARTIVRLATMLMQATIRMT
jgi:hypothetical protein